MPHAKTALILMMAFALPRAAEALGLGEIHVDSALDEPLAAEVDIVGATPEELAGITASIANRETFLRFGADRPAFLSTAAFRIATDGKGQPVLAIRSTDAFTEPLINLLIDLRWHSGELIRQYTLLLDPARFSSDTRVAEAARAARGPDPSAAPAAAEPPGKTAQIASQATPIPERTSPAAGRAVPPESVEVTAGATLRGIASRVSSRGDAGLQRTMIAIFRANPNAFDGNINRLRLGAMLSIPSFREVSNISAADAAHDIRLQMETWRASAKLAEPAKPAEVAAAKPVSVPDEGEFPREAAAARQESPKALDGATSDETALERRVALLEQGLNELRGALDREQATLTGMQARLALAEGTPAVTAVVAPAMTVGPPATAVAPALTVGPVAAVVAPAVTIGPAVAAVGPPPADSPAAGSPAVKSARPTGGSIAAVLALAGGAFGALYTWRRRRTLDPTGAPAEAKTQHSRAPRIAAQAAASREDVPVLRVLYEKGRFKERRSSLVDVLTVAVNREPDRRDLRIKLLETYYAATATSRQGFLEVARSLAEEREHMTGGEWGKIAEMGRQIAADNDLFASDRPRADAKDLPSYA